MMKKILMLILAASLTCQIKAQSNLQALDTMMTISATQWDSIRSACINRNGHLPYPTTYYNYTEITYILSGKDTVDATTTQVSDNQLIRENVAYDIRIEEYYTTFKIHRNARYLLRKKNNYSSRPFAYTSMMYEDEDVIQLKKKVGSEFLTVWIDTLKREIYWGGEGRTNLLNHLYPFVVYLSGIHALDEYAILDIRQEGKLKHITYLMVCDRQSVAIDSLVRIFPYTVTWDTTKNEVVKISQMTKLPPMKGTGSSRFVIDIQQSKLTRRDKRATNLERYFDVRKKKGRGKYKDYKVIEGRHKSIYSRKDINYM